MIPHKTHRGQAALERLKVFEGIPPPFHRMKRQVIPDAMRILRLKPGRKYCRVGNQSRMQSSLFNLGYPAYSGIESCDMCVLQPVSTGEKAISQAQGMAS